MAAGSPLAQAVRKILGVPTPQRAGGVCWWGAGQSAKDRVSAQTCAILIFTRLGFLTLCLRLVAGLFRSFL